MNFALPLVVVTCVAGVQAARRKQRPGFDANLAPVEKRQLQLDGWSAFIGALMMIAHQSSVYRRLGGLDNLQIVLLPLPVFLCMYVWSSLRPWSYLRHRTLAVVVLRLIVFWPPHITQLRVFDATVSAPSSIPFVSWAVDTFMVFITCRVWLMIFTSLGAQGPFRAHLIIQTLNFLILATRGTCFCDSQLLTAPLMEQRAAAMHSVLAALASLMLPGSHMLVPASARGRCWALLLLLWSTMGWLLPTLVMLPMKAAAVAGQREGQAGELAAAAGQVAGGMHRQETAAAGQEAGGEQRQGAAAGGTANCWAYKVRTSFERALMSALCTLEPSAAEVYPWAPHPEDIYLHPRLLWVLRWWVLISIIWAAACVAAGN